MKKGLKKMNVFERNLSPVIGRHVFGNLWDIDDRMLTDLKFLKNLIVEAAKAGNLHIIDIMERQFDQKDSPDIGGVSIIALITESHISLHTWPESRYATLDIYSCGNESNPTIALDYIISLLKPVSYKIFTVDRSTSPEKSDSMVFNHL